MRRLLLFVSLLLLALALGCPPQLNDDPPIIGLDDDDATDPQDDDDDISPQPYVWVDPTELDFGVVDAGVQATGEVEVGNQGTGDLQIQSIVFSNTELFALLNGSDFDVILAPGEVTVLIVGFTPQSNGEVVASMIVATDDPVAPEISVTLRGTGAAGELEVWPISYDFGPTEIGCERLQEFTIGNVGAPNLMVTSIEFVDDAGQGELTMHHDLELPLLIGAAIYPIEVRYLPIDMEPDSGSLSVHSTDPQGSPFTVAVYGQGTPGADGSDAFTGDGATAAFTLSQTPVVDTLEVTLDTVPIFTGWSWVAAAGAVTFDSEHIPEEGDAVEVSYTVWGCSG